MKPEWLPGWTNPDEYPDPETTSLHQWAWEFLRRNPEYQKDYDTYKKLPDRSLWENGNSPELEPGETKEEYADRSKLAHKSPLYFDLPLKYFGFPPNMLNPAKQELPPQTKFKFEGPNYFVTFHAGESSQHSLAPGHPSEVVCNFRLTHPIGPQLKAVKLLLTKQQRRFQSKHKHDNTRKRSHPRKYPVYLRILDALASDVSKEDIAFQFFKDIPEWGGDYEFALAKLSDDIGAANLLCSSDYQYIVIKGSPDYWCS